MNFNDTFLNIDHLLSSFPNRQIIPHENNPNKMLPPYRLVVSIFIIYIYKYNFINHCIYLVVFIFKKLLIRMVKS